MKLSLEDKNWKEFRIGNVFDVSGTVTTHPSKLISGCNTPRITTASTNNGFDGMYKNLPTEKGGVITVDSATVGYISYQSADFIATDHVEKLILRHFKKIDRFLGNFLVSALTKATVGKYGYGYKFSQTRISEQKILLPINSQGNPDYDFMEAYMRQKEQEKLDKYKEFISKRLEELKDYKDVEPLEEKEWGEFKIEDMFSIKIGKNVDGNKVNKNGGKIPYVTRKETNNGLDGFINYDSSYLNKDFPVITIGNETAQPLVQKYSFFTGTKVNILKHVNNISVHCYEFISKMLEMHKVKYSYSFTANSTRLKKQKIMLPINQDNQPDYEYMENYMKKLEYTKLKQYLDYKRVSLQ